MTSHYYTTLDEKVALINDCAHRVRLSQRKLREKYKVSKGAAYNILQRKDEYTLMLVIYMYGYFS